MKKWLSVIFLCVALSTGYGTKAQVISKAWAEQDVPAKICGNWALPDCKSYEEALIITRHFYLKSDKNGSQLWPLAVANKQKDYWVMPIEGVKRPVQVQADGVLKVGLPDRTPKKWPKSWDRLHMDGHREYMGCVEIPAILPDPLVRVMQHIDEIAAACHASLSPSCTKLLFDIADENKNGTISAREMKTAAAMLASIATLATYKTVSREAMDKTVYQSLREADRISARLMQNGRELTYEDFSGFLAKADSAPLREAVRSVGMLVPGFKE